MTNEQLESRLGQRPQPGATILVVEDDAAVRALLGRILGSEGYAVTGVADGAAAVRAVATEQPDLVLLDVGLPRLDGYEVTRRLRSDARLATLPILLLTGRTSLDDIVTGLDAGADDFIRKPFERSELLARIRSALRLRGALVGMEAAQGVVTALANAIEAKDSPTERHCQRLAHLAVALGTRVGLPTTDLDAVAYGALLHDVGKIGVPDAVLAKAGPLNDEEWSLVRRHPEIGERICAPLAAFAAFGPIIRHHHERWDGSGYPDHLRGVVTPLGARIVGIVDAFDAMTHDRPYRVSRSVAVAVAELASLAGRQFDPDLVPIFVEVLEQMPPPTVRDLEDVPPAVVARRFGRPPPVVPAAAGG